jgi:hypothetical protein
VWVIFDVLWTWLLATGEEKQPEHPPRGVGSLIAAGLMWAVLIGAVLIGVSLILD